MKEDKAVKNPAFGLNDIVKDGLFFIKKYDKMKNVLISIIKFGFLQKFKSTNNILFGTFSFSDYALLEKIKIL